MREPRQRRVWGRQRPHQQYLWFLPPPPSSSRGFRRSRFQSCNTSIQSASFRLSLEIRVPEWIYLSARRSVRPIRLLSDFFRLTNYLLNKRDLSRLDDVIVEAGGFDLGLILGSPEARQGDC